MQSLSLALAFVTLTPMFHLVSLIPTCLDTNSWSSFNSLLSLFNNERMECRGVLSWVLFPLYSIFRNFHSPTWLPWPLFCSWPTHFNLMSLKIQALTTNCSSSIWIWMTPTLLKFTPHFHSPQNTCSFSKVFNPSKFQYHSYNWLSQIT